MKPWKFSTLRELSGSREDESEDEGKEEGKYMVNMVNMAKIVTS